MKSFFVAFFFLIISYCNRLFKLLENERELESISRSPRNENPKLKFLEEKILSYYEGGAVSLGIIFCKTRDTVEALTNWMKETPSLAVLNPSNAVGSSKPSSIQGDGNFYLLFISPSHLLIVCLRLQRHNTRHLASGLAWVGWLLLKSRQPTFSDTSFFKIYLIYSPSGICLTTGIIGAMILFFF